MPCKLILAGVAFAALCATPLASAQPGNNLQSGAPQFGATLAASGESDDANPASDFRILATTRVSTMERELNEAAAEGFRLEIVGDDIDSGEGLVDEIFALVLGDTRPHRFSYRLVTLKDLTTMEEERARALTVAAVEAYATADWCRRRWEGTPWWSWSATPTGRLFLWE